MLRLHNKAIPKKPEQLACPVHENLSRPPLPKHGDQGEARVFSATRRSKGVATGLRGKGAATEGRHGEVEEC